MASELCLNPIYDFYSCTRRTEKFGRKNLRLACFPSPNVMVLSNSRVSQKSNSTLIVCNSVKQQPIQVPNWKSNDSEDGFSSSKNVLVVGGTGNVGQLVVSSLLKRGIKAHLLLRDPNKATSCFGIQDKKTLKVSVGDTRHSDELDPTMFKDVTHVICCTGTTAFPSMKWKGDNTPEKVDWEGVRNLISVLPRTLKRFVLVSSIGVTKFNEMPWRILNLFGVLKFKKMGEEFLCNSGLPFTIIRPGRLNGLATTGAHMGVCIGKGDKLTGETSRLVVAEACVQLLDIEFAEGQIYEINSFEGEGPGSDPEKWIKMFRDADMNDAP